MISIISQNAVFVFSLWFFDGKAADVSFAVFSSPAMKKELCASSFLSSYSSYSSILFLLRQPVMPVMPAMLRSISPINNGRLVLSPVSEEVSMSFSGNVKKLSQIVIFRVLTIKIRNLL